jgi:putative oxygen-independent coproporphyrinogen III oxidase
VKPDSLYLHIPFCGKICAYCDFPKVLFNPKWAFSYVAEVKKEVLSYPIDKVSTIYLGGGTPSLLSEDLLKDLLSFLYPYLKEKGEFTLEGNPESLTPSKLRLIHDLGVNRLSIGVESADPALLKMMGRGHSFSEAKAVIQEAKAAGFDNLSADLIYALPNESLETLNRDIDALLSLEVDHLSTYCLSVNPGTVFANHGYREMDQDLAADQYELILARLREKGYDRYEVSNFARNGKKSRHNLTYWKDLPYYAAGMGASGYLGGVRYDNTRNLARYLQGEWRAQEEIVTPEEDIKYFFLTNLRLEEGFSDQVFKARFGFSFFERYEKAIRPLCEEGLAERSNDVLKASDRGILLLDRLLLALY